MYRKRMSDALQEARAYSLISEVMVFKGGRGMSVSKKDLPVFRAKGWKLKEELEEAVNPKEEITTSIPETNTIDLAEKSNETENKTDQQTASINTTNELASTNNTTSIISYKVQILAAHKVANQKYFSTRHQYNKGFDIENHEGWVKYTTGEFNEYLKARNKREDLSRYNFPGPFVTAYNNGNRITVQEALMTSKQDWIQ